MTRTETMQALWLEAEFEVEKYTWVERVALECAANCLEASKEGLTSRDVKERLMRCIADALENVE